MDEKEYGDEQFIYAMALMEEKEEREREKEQQNKEEQEGNKA
jgi:hypothetical protein